MFFSLVAMSQSATFGFSMGANFSNLIGEGKIEGSKPRIGVCPYIHLDIPLAYESFLEVSLGYSQQGVNVKSDIIDNSQSDGYKGTTRIQTNITKHVDYLTLPVQWKQTFGDLYVKAGPYAAFALKASSKKLIDKYYGTDSTYHYDSSKDTTEAGKGFNQSFVNSLRQFDVGAALSIGFQTSIGRSVDICFDASYRMGFFSVEDNPQNRKSTLRNQYFCVSAGLFFVKNRRSKTYRRR
jgi:hypothetical protein